MTASKQINVLQNESLQEIGKYLLSHPAAGWYITVMVNLWPSILKQLLVTQFVPLAASMPPKVLSIFPSVLII